MKAVTIPPHSSALAITKTCIYKTIGNVSILIDVYLPSAVDVARPPIMLYIHGGGWTGANRTHYPRPLFDHFLCLGFIVTSMDFRLLPETDIDGQMEDVRDAEPWLRNDLALEVKEYFSNVQGDKVIVVGGSAGAHLALLTPKLWTIQPTGILSLYGPTDMNSLPALHSDRLAKIILPSCTSEILAAGTNFDQPPTQFAVTTKPEDYRRPRSVMILTVFRKGMLKEYLLRGLIRSDDGKLKFPGKDSVTKEELDKISPIELCKHTKFPPTYQVMGAKDDVFEVSHAIKFHKALGTLGSNRQTMILFEAGHAFDIGAEVGGKLHEKVIGPAVEWVAQFAGVKPPVATSKWGKAGDISELGFVLEK
ncbi:alpha/beta-hydrolase [Cadophora sp. DSE1049]|nr:alpha/beta-hydrolase [Cadophora sp. DSE1049]